ncbi:MAG TPA: cupin domain-containing protein [Parvularculaceae bacterium]|nr:cupin domain-containing protein [Parvularculaceae bacterium]
MTAAEVIAALGLAPHPEGGWYRETWRAAAGNGERAAGAAIYYLLEAGQCSHWHRIDADEVWLYHAGAPLALSLSPNGAQVETRTLGADLASGEHSQIVVPAHCWQAARSLGAFTLASCVVAPAFDFAGFEMAPKGWAPPEA